MHLRVSRPGFLNGIAQLAKSDAGDYPHLPSIMAWRKGKRDKDYDPNTMAGRQELRNEVAGRGVAGVDGSTGDRVEPPTVGGDLVAANRVVGIRLVRGATRCCRSRA